MQEEGHSWRDECVWEIAEFIVRFRNHTGKTSKDGLVGDQGSVGDGDLFKIHFGTQFGTHFGTHCETQIDPSIRSHISLNDFPGYHLGGRQAQWQHHQATRLPPLRSVCETTMQSVPR